MAVNMSIEALIKLQTDRLDSLSKILANFKRDPTARKTKPYFEQRIKRLNDISNHFRVTHDAIVCSDVGPENEYFQSDIASKFDEAHLEVICILMQRQEEMFPPPQKIEPVKETAQTSESHSKCLSSVQFPQLPVPSFSGKFTEWPSFHDTFNRLIHLNGELSCIQKFHYLKQSLPVDRDIDIHQMLLTEINYTTAWQMLLKRYDNPRILFAHHMNALYALPTLVKEKADDIKSLLNVANVCINEFKRLKLPISECDHWIVHYLATKLPNDTHQAWERHLGSQREIPTFSKFEEFLVARLFTIDAIENRNLSFNASTVSKWVKDQRDPHHSTVKISKTVARATHNIKSFHSAKTETGGRDSCGLCGEPHIIRRCPSFLSKDCFERKAIVDKTRLCVNCLSKSHTLSQCTSSKNCLQCGQRHHTLLHFPLKTTLTHTAAEPSAQYNSHNYNTTSRPPKFQHTPPFNNLPTHAANLNSQRLTNAHATVAANSTHVDASMPIESPEKQVLLATALVSIRNEITNECTYIYALIDQGSEGTLISETVVQRLKLQRNPTSADICGVGPNTFSQSKSMVNFALHSCHDESFSAHVDNAYVLKHLTAQLPSRHIVPPSLMHLQDLSLADPAYYRPKRIDLIIGADMIAQILLPETRIGGADQPIAQNTHLGWILFGRIQSSPSPTVTVRCHYSNIQLEALVQKFYESEQVPNETPMSAQEQWCEEFFRTTHIRQDNGKYLVRLPLKSLYDPNQTLGKSRQMALNRFYQLERRLQRNPELHGQYADGIEDYFRLNQLTPATTSEDQHCAYTATNRPTVTSCVLPHHAVVKEESSTTKLRIVYDASSKTSNGRSLNDLLCIGRPLQNDLPALILNWRIFKYVFLADIKKMYRCIDMNKDDAQYQRILWRNQNGDIQDYCLTTVTFGTASAPYTAIRVLHQLAHDEKERFPLAEKILLHDIYVDDVLSGGDTIHIATLKRDQLTAALQSAGMELRKWASNTPELLRSIPRDHQATGSTLQLNANETVKTLGLHWQPHHDSFTFSINFPINYTATKRSVLSTIARLFDPLGFLTPITVAAKIILKEIWITRVKRQQDHWTGLDWDEELPSTLNTTWQRFIADLPQIKGISIPRWLRYLPEHILSVEIHCFCDGSSSAYAAAAYLRVEYKHGDIYTHLVAAKSKVTPTNSITIPRVELCGAVLATTLANWAHKNLKDLGDIPICYWTDATIILHWINGDPNRWKLYVANRTSKILSLSTPSQWNYVNTLENPADCATRGLSPKQLKTFTLWWSGPPWLSLPKAAWPHHSIDIGSFDNMAVEEKPTKLYVHSTATRNSMLSSFSSFTKLLRITAWCKRIGHNLRPINRKTRRTGTLSTGELQESLFLIVRLVQREAFGVEINFIRSQHPLPNSSKLVSLTPFLDDNDVLRIRGRLKHAILPYRQKHPMILPSNHFFTRLVIDNAHHNTLHGGVQLTLCFIRQQFWIIHARKTVLNHLRHCIQCFRNKPHVTTQLMGDLPMQRISPPQRAFLATGVDYTGAIELKSSKYRGHTVYKGYIAIFICLATKAVHLEAVTGLTAEHFLWALQRFIGRRGICHDLYSDCGTNFIGADAILKNNYKRFVADIEREIIPKLSAQKIQWHFNPPHSPNFGGLWEANVKSIKYHLKRIVGGTKITYEQLSTVLVRIEACLNSRPLCPLTSDPDDLFVLTPGHFLIGDALLSPPDVPVDNKSISSQYLELQRLVQHFWARWSSDWLSHLQARPKWRHEEPNLSVNELVLVKDDRLPPNQWMLGRITELHPGSDQLVRVVTVRTNTGLYKRSVSKICRLPIITTDAHIEPLN